MEALIIQELIKDEGHKLVFLSLEKFANFQDDSKLKGKELSPFSFPFSTSPVSILLFPPPLPFTTEH